MARYGGRVVKPLQLPFDPIARAAAIWERRFGPAGAMAAVTSIMRAQQILLAQLDTILRPARSHVRPLRGSRAAELQPPRRAAARHDRRTADGAPDKRHQHHRPAGDTGSGRAAAQSARWQGAPRGDHRPWPRDRGAGDRRSDGGGFRHAPATTGSGCARSSPCCGGFAWRRAISPTTTRVHPGTTPTAKFVIAVTLLLERKSYRDHGIGFHGLACPRRHG